MRWILDCFCIEYSGKGPSGVWILTAKPWKHGIVAVKPRGREWGVSEGDDGRRKR
jgi:hypothetical protein